jgi:hypothetical protein
MVALLARKSLSFLRTPLPLPKPFAAQSPCHSRIVWHFELACAGADGDSARHAELNLADDVRPGGGARWRRLVRHRGLLGPGNSATRADCWHLNRPALARLGTPRRPPDRLANADSTQSCSELPGRRKSVSCRGCLSGIPESSTLSSMGIVMRLQLRPDYSPLLASRIGSDGQQEAQNDATGREDRTLEEAPAALELDRCRRLSRQ